MRIVVDIIGIVVILLVPLPPWIAPQDALDDWQTSAWDNKMPFIRAKEWTKILAILCSKAICYIKGIVERMITPDRGEISTSDSRRLLCG